MTQHFLLLLVAVLNLSFATSLSFSIPDWSGQKCGTYKKFCPGDWNNGIANTCQDGCTGCTGYTTESDTCTYIPTEATCQADSGKKFCPATASKLASTCQSDCTGCTGYTVAGKTTCLAPVLVCDTTGPITSRYDEDNAGGAGGQDNMELCNGKLPFVDFWNDMIGVGSCKAAPAPVTCGDGTTLTANQCETTSSPVTCGDGTALTANKCEIVSPTDVELAKMCGEGTTYDKEKKKCATDPTSRCTPGLTNTTINAADNSADAVESAGSSHFVSRTATLAATVIVVLFCKL